MRGAEPFSRIFTDIEHHGGQYIIDNWQRHYEWTKIHWLNLYETINNIDLSLNPKPKKWLGNFICYYPDNNIGNALVVDGQQRLTTITIIMSVIRDLSLNENSYELAVQINRNLLDRDNHNFIIYKNDLTTNSVYESIITHKLDNIKDSYKSNVFYQAYKFYINIFKDYTYENLKDFYEKLNCLYININQCESLEEARETYRDVNGKNKPVSENDKIKACICDIIDTSNLDNNQKNEYNAKINEISKTLLKGLGKSFYCRYYYFKENEWFTKGKISDKIIKYLNNINQVKEIFDLYDYEKTYNEFNHPALIILYDDFKKYNIDIDKQYIILNTFINAIIRSTISGQGLIHEEAFCGAVNKILNFIALSNNELRDKINLDLISSKQLNKNEISIVSNDIFIQKLKDFNLYNARHNMGQYILWKINQYYEDLLNSKEHVYIENPTIDHINPQINNSIYKNLIGNLTILSQPANSSKNKKEVTNIDASSKIINSSLKINHELTKKYNLNDGWTDSNILKRTNELGQILIKIF